MIRTLTGRATVAILAGFITGAAHALPLTTNLANPSSGSGTVRSGGAPGVTLPEWRANAFTNEAMAWTLESVVLDIAVRSPGTSPGGFQVAIHADDSALPGPGTLLQVLSGASDPAPGQPVYTGSVALAPGATYWVVASVLNSSFTAQYG
ncbi:MAG: hypothetical protein HKP27_16850, partial [Myxococcales bacterium]|nr:hypothetical protein [Myxococcales bacterium]